MTNGQNLRVFVVSPFHRRERRVIDRPDRSSRPVRSSPSRSRAWTVVHAKHRKPISSALSACSAVQQGGESRIRPYVSPFAPLRGIPLPDVGEGRGGGIRLFVPPFVDGPYLHITGRYTCRVGGTPLSSPRMANTDRRSTVVLTRLKSGSTVPPTATQRCVPSSQR